MADQSTLAGLLGMDPAELQSLLAQLGPTDEMRKEANQQKWITTGLGILGAQPGNTWRAIGQGGLLGQAAYQDLLQKQLAQRGTDLQQVLALRNAAAQANALKQWQAALNGGDETQPGPAEPFQSQGGAAGQMNAALTGTPAAVNALPTRIPAAGSTLRERLAKANIAGHAAGLPDMSAAINTLYRQPVPLREGAGFLDENNVYHPLPKPPPGFFYDPTKNQFVPVAGGQESIAKAEATPKAVDLAFSPQTGVMPGGGQGVVGNRLSALFGAGPLPYGAPQPFAQQQAGPAPQGLATAPQAAQGPVQTELSPEQRKNSEELGAEMAASRTAAAQSSKAQAELGQIAQTLNYFKPGPTLPARAAIAGVAQEIPGIGQSAADLLVPNSKTALPAIQAMEKIAVGLTAEQSKVFGSREGQQVIGMIKSAMPNAAQIPGAPETIVQSQMAVHQWFIDRDQALQQWVSQPEHHGSSAGFAQFWDKTHPVSSYIPDLPALKNIAEGKPPNAPRTGEETAQHGERTIVRTGTQGSRKVVQYSDGSVEWAK